MRLYVIIVFFLICNTALGETLKPLTNNTFEEVMNDEKANHVVLEGCISLYSAITELTKKQHPELAKSFYEMANILYPYGLLSLSKVQNISINQAEKFFFQNISILSKKYIEAMNINGKKFGSYLRGSFLGDDLFFCNEVTKSLNLVVNESIN